MHDDDAELWRRFTADIMPIRRRKDVSRQKAKTLSMEISDKRTEAEPPVMPLPRLHKSFPELDGKTARRLQRGKLPIDATLDLHGYTQNQAYQKLLSFVTTAHARRYRCILVITGKGGRYKDARPEHWLEPERGVIRSQLPNWVATSRIRELVLRIQPAARQHGGEGAYYLYLRRQK